MLICTGSLDHLSNSCALSGVLYVLQVLGLHPVESVESPALTQQDGRPLALRMQWQAGSDHQTLADQKLAIHVGQLYAGYAPGLLIELRTYTRQAWCPQEPPQTGSRAADASEPAQEKGQPDPASKNHLAAPAWLTGGITLDASALSLQLVALSSQADSAQALAVSIDRCSLHLGALKPSARPGSLLAQLFSLQKQSLPSNGLRMALSGVQLWVASRWVHSANRAGQAEDVFKAAGAQAVSESFDILALSNPTAPAEASEAGSDDVIDAGSWVLLAAASHVSVQLSCLQLAAAIAAAQGVSGEMSRSFQQPLQQRLQPQAAGGSGQQAAWLTGVALRVSCLWLMHSPAGAAQLASKLGDWRKHSEAASICRADAIDVSANSATAQARLSISIKLPTLAVGPGVQLDIPLVELSTQHRPLEAAAAQSSANSQRAEAETRESSRSQSSALPAGEELPVLYMHSVQLCATGANTAISLESATFGLSYGQVTLLVSGTSNQACVH